MYARRPFACPLKGRLRITHLRWAREHASWTRQQWAFVLFIDESQFTLKSDSGLERTRQQIQPTQHSFGGGGIMIWVGIILGGHTDLPMFHGGNLTGVRYHEEIFDAYLRPYAAAICNDFILMDENARPH